MPHAKRVRAGAFSPQVPVEGLANTTESAAEGPANVGTTVSNLQPVLGVSAVCDKQAQHEQGAPSIKTKSSSAGAKALPVLPWMRVPISIDGGTGVPLSQVTGLHPVALAALHAGRYWAACSLEFEMLQQMYNTIPQTLQPSGQYTELFPVQAAAWRVLAGGLSKAHDLCIAAPTGSGKTLAYALPVLHCLVG